MYQYGINAKDSYAIYRLRQEATKHFLKSLFDSGVTCSGRYAFAPFLMPLLVVALYAAVN